MLKKLLGVSLLLGLAFSVSAPLRARNQDQPKKETAAKEDKVEGVVSMVSKDKSTLSVRPPGSPMEKKVAYDKDTKWVSQEHGAKKVNEIDAAQVGDGDRVICVGKLDEKGVLHARLINKRITPR